MQLGYIGLGKMGTRMVEKLLAGGHTVVGWNRTPEIVEEFTLVLAEKKLSERFVSADSLESLVHSLNTPRIIWIMLPAGEATQAVIDEVSKYSEKGDIIIDGGNSFFEDTERRSKALSAQGIAYLGIGVSGGVKAAENGYPLMVGGPKEAYDSIQSILDTLSQPNGGYDYFGTGGAGHFVKMVHNGIEYGMMQAIGEGFGVLDKAPYQFDLTKVAALWQKGTIITSNLMEWAKDALEKDPRLTALDGVIAATGEADWTVEQAKKEQVPVENIQQSLEFRKCSQTDSSVSSSFAARLVAALRREFGGHSVKKV